METKSGSAFHVHHDILVEYCFDYDERVRAIKQDKPQNEQKLRLRLFKLLPANRIPPQLLGAKEVYAKAGNVYVKARETYAKTDKGYVKAREAYAKTGEAYAKAGKAYGKAREVYMPDLIKLHKELCLDCPWNGTTIFTRKDKNGEWY